MSANDILTDGGEVTSTAQTENQNTSSRMMGVLKSVIAFFLVAIPSLFMMLLSVDAPLVAGTDAFIFASLQVLFLLIFFVYRAWRS